MSNLLKKHYLFLAIFSGLGMVFMWSRSVELVSKWPLFIAGIMFGAFVYTRPHKEFLKIGSRFAIVLAMVVSVAAVFLDSGSGEGWFVIIPFFSFCVFFFLFVFAGLLFVFLLKEIYINIRQLFS